MTQLARQIEQMHDVGRLHLKGNDPNDIARQLGIPRKDVLYLFREWKKFVAEQLQTTGVREKLISVVEEANEHWALVIKEAWETVQQADDDGALAVKVQALKLLAGVEKDRAAMYQQLGASYDADLADELAERERQEEVLKGILRDVTNTCDNCRLEVRRRLSEISSEAEVIEVEANEP